MRYYTPRRGNNTIQIIEAARLVKELKPKIEQR